MAAERRIDYYSELIRTHGNPSFVVVGNEKISDLDEMHIALHVLGEMRKRRTRWINGVRKLASLGEINPDDLKPIEARKLIASVTFPKKKKEEETFLANFHEEHDFYLLYDETNNLNGTIDRYAIKTPGTRLGRLVVDVHAPMSENPRVWAAEKLNILSSGKIPEGIIREVL